MSREGRVISSARRRRDSRWPWKCFAMRSWRIWVSSMSGAVEEEAVVVVEGRVEVEVVVAVEEGVVGEVEAGGKVTRRKSQNGKSRFFFVDLRSMRTTFRRGSHRKIFIRLRRRDRPCPRLPRCSRRRIWNWITASYDQATSIPTGEGIREATSHVGEAPSEGEVVGRDEGAGKVGNVGKVEKVVEREARASEAVEVGAEAEGISSFSRGQVRRGESESPVMLIRLLITRRPLQVRPSSCNGRPRLPLVIHFHQTCQACRPRLLT